MIRSLALSCVILLALPPATGNMSVPAALQLFEAGRYQEAADMLRAAAAQAPWDSQAQHWLARCLYELHDYDGAVTAAERSVKLEPQNAEYHRWLGRAYGGKAEETRSFFLARKVKREFEEAVRLNPASVASRRDLIDYYLEAPWIVGGSRDKGRQQVEAVASLDPIEGRLARAVYWTSEKKPELAAAEYLQVLDSEPKYAQPYFEAAGFFQRQQSAARVKQAVEAAARTASSDPRLSYYRGIARILAGNRLAEAEQFLKFYLATPPRSEFPSHASAHVWLGQLFEKMGRRQEAAFQFRGALRLHPAYEEARAALRRMGESE